jgi:hypothetical protein
MVCFARYESLPYDFLPSPLAQVTPKAEPMRALPILDTPYAVYCFLLLFCFRGVLALFPFLVPTLSPYPTAYLAAPFIAQVSLLEPVGSATKQKKQQHSINQGNK